MMAVFVVFIAVEQVLWARFQNGEYFWTVETWEVGP